ncbi:hypothetical protein MH171_001859 [Vibrio parahaemolyticus]|nr:hypothetical protein [Vibrio parahaemolyticus]ELA7254389.1 hypothetical protein [Vibrio parahaemolyticus]EMF1839558.1 hypothetical protein [Vibrio parahaemolyticus]
MKAIEILKKNRANFRIRVEKVEADLVIDKLTESFEVGSTVKGYLVPVPQKAFKGRLPRFKKYTFSKVEPEKQVDAVLKFNVEKWRFEIHTSSTLSGVCKRNKMQFDGENCCWYTACSHISNKVRKEMSVNNNVEFDKDYSKNIHTFLRSEERADERYEQNAHKPIDELEVALSDDELSNVLSKVCDYSIKLRGKWWKSDYKEYRLFEVYNGGRFGTHSHVQRDGYSKQFRSSEYIKRVCHAYDCQTFEDLVTKL